MIEKFDILANGEEIEMVVEAKDMNAAPRAASIKNNGISGLGRGRPVIGGNFAVVEGVILSSRHEIENEGDEEKRERGEEQHPSESVDLVGQGFRLLLTGALEHLVEFRLK